MVGLEDHLPLGVDEVDEDVAVRPQRLGVPGVGDPRPVTRPARGRRDRARAERRPAGRRRPRRSGRRSRGSPGRPRPRSTASLPMFRPRPLGGPCHAPSLAPPQCSPPTRSRTLRTTSRHPSSDPAGRSTLAWWHWPVSSTTRTPSRSRFRARTQSRNSSTSGRPERLEVLPAPDVGPAARGSRRRACRTPLPPCARLGVARQRPLRPGELLAADEFPALRLGLEVVERHRGPGRPGAAAGGDRRESRRRETCGEAQDRSESAPSHEVTSREPARRTWRDASSPAPVAKPDAPEIVSGMHGEDDRPGPTACVPWDARKRDGLRIGCGRPVDPPPPDQERAHDRVTVGDGRHRRRGPDRRIGRHGDPRAEAGREGDRRGPRPGEARRGDPPRGDRRGDDPPRGRRGRSGCGRGLHARLADRAPIAASSRPGPGRPAPDRRRQHEAGDRRGRRGRRAARAIFCGSHPLAGSERQGVSASRGDLFAGRSVVLTPTGRTPADRLRRCRRLLGVPGRRDLRPLAGRPRLGPRVDEPPPPRRRIGAGRGRSPRGSCPSRPARIGTGRGWRRRTGDCGRTSSSPIPPDSPGRCRRSGIAWTNSTGSWPPPTPRPWSPGGIGRGRIGRIRPRR